MVTILEAAYNRDLVTDLTKMINAATTPEQLSDIVDKIDHAKTLLPHEKKQLHQEVKNRIIKCLRM